MKKYKFNFWILPILFLGILTSISSCKVDDVDKSLFIGEYTVVQKCGSDSETLITIIEDVSFSDRSVYVTNFPNNSQNIALGTIQGNKISFAKQFEDYAFEGEGKLTGNTIEIEFTLFEGTTNISTECSATFTRN